MTDPTTAAERLVDAATAPLLGVTQRERHAARIAAPAQTYAGVPSTAGAAIAGLVRDLGPYPYPAAPAPEDDVPDARVLSVVDQVLDNAASALDNLEARLDELILRLAPALADDPDDHDGPTLKVDPDYTDPRSDLVVAIDRLSLHADRLATRVRLTTERLDL